MMALSAVFAILVIIFALIGWMRGWAKELLVIFSVIVCIFLMEIINRYFPEPVRGYFDTKNDASVFWVRTILFIIVSFFGYQTPNLPKLSGGKFARDKFSDQLLGAFIGAINGFLIVGSIWYYLDYAGYPFKNLVTRPNPTPAIMAILAPVWLKVPTVYFAIVVAFLFVLVVFI